MEKTNPELVALYREQANYYKTGKEISEITQMKIDKLKRRPVILSTMTENKEKHLMETITKFEQLLNEGNSKAEAARKLGYSDYASIWKKYQEMARIKTEQKTTQSTFKESLKVNVENVQKVQNTNGGDLEIDETISEEIEQD